jgi:hypothetical protein
LTPIVANDPNPTSFPSGTSSESPLAEPVLFLRLRPWICTCEDLLLLRAWLPSQVVEVLFVRVLAERGLEEEEDEDLLLFLLLLLLLLLLLAFLLSFLLVLPLETECRA